MSERLSSADVAFFYLESPRTPQHVGNVAIFAPPGPSERGLDYERLIRLLEERIALVPRYRQKMRTVPGNLANPVWVDDPRFDITYHVRRSALPQPGSEEALLDFCARIMSRLLDRDRPLWEMYLVEGLAGGRVAIVTKTHHSMADGISALHIGQVLLDETPQPRRTVSAVWMPHGEPSGPELVLGAVRGMVSGRPHALVDAVRLGIRDAQSATRWAWGLTGSVVGTAVSLVRPSPPSPLRAGPGRQRRLAVARTPLRDYRTVAQACDASVNDVALATVAGALRGWLTQRGEQLGPTRSVRALVPVSVLGSPHDSDQLVGQELGARMTTLLVDLPIGEPDPLRRLAQIRYALAVHDSAGHAVGADALVAISGFAPPTLHALAARAAGGLTRRMSDLLVANVPGAQEPRYAVGARMLETFPVLPLAPGQAVSIGLTSYDGSVWFGINADRDAVPDAALLAQRVEAALAELVAAAGAGRAGRAVATPRRRGRQR